MILSALLALSMSQACPSYTRTRTNDVNPNAFCLFWKENTQLKFEINDQGNPENAGDAEFTAVENAMAAWNTQLTACASLTMTAAPRTSSRLAEFIKGAAVHHNVILWRFTKCSAAAPGNDSCWNEGNCGNKYDCWQHANTALALTTTSFEPSSGEILDSDIELNVPGYLFTVVDSPVCVAPNFALTCVATDIQNAMTHELGHSLGLAHSCMPGSVMAAMSPPGELSKRVLDPGSKAAACEVYPKNMAAVRCGTGGTGTGGGSGSGAGGGTTTGAGGGTMSATGGGTGGTAGGSGAGGGAGPVTPGCGCTSAPQGVLLLALVGLLRRRRKQHADSERVGFFRPASGSRQQGKRETLRR